MPAGFLGFSLLIPVGQEPVALNGRQGLPRPLLAGVLVAHVALPVIASGGLSYLPAPDLAKYSVYRKLSRNRGAEAGVSKDIARMFTSSRAPSTEGG